MTSCRKIANGLLEGKCDIPYGQAHEVFQRLQASYKLHFLLESKEVSLFSGRWSLIGIDPIVKIIGKDTAFEIQKLHRRGDHFFEILNKQMFSFCDVVEKTDEKISGVVKPDKRLREERKRSKLQNIAQVIRTLLKRCSVAEKTLLGLYGAFSYDFIRLFEDLHDRLPNDDIPQFTLFLYDSFLLFDHIKQTASIVVFRRTNKELQHSCDSIQKKLKVSVKKKRCKLGKPNFALSQEEFTDLVNIGKKYITEGEMVQVVFSNRLSATFKGDPFALYLRYRHINPSPYLFFYEFGNEQLIGASPEMMVRYEQGFVHLRPIAGTIKRGCDAIEDHEQMLKLLNSKKERAELEMLIDLGRSDLSRICQPGITISDYRFVEKYSRVMHTVAHLTGKLRPSSTGLDALISCLNAGTVTGAPKVAAMRAIEQHEKTRRGYYGGAVGQLTFSGEVDTAIIIRTAHIKNGLLTYQSGAGIVYDSVPEQEYEETKNKARAFLEIFSNKP